MQKCGGSRHGLQRRTNEIQAQQFGQGLASQQYDKEYSRASDEFSNYYNRLAALAQGGQQAVQATGNQGAQYAQNG